MSFATINRSATKTLSTSIPAIEDAFAAEPSLKKRVYDAIGTHIPTIFGFCQASAVTRCCCDYKLTLIFSL